MTPLRSMQAEWIAPAVCRRMRGLAGLLAVGVLAGGCSWFSWVPGIGGKDDKKAALEPAKLQDFAAEARIERLWRASIGAGLGRKRPERLFRALPISVRQIRLPEKRSRASTTP